MVAFPSSGSVLLGSILSTKQQIVYLIDLSNFDIVSVVKFGLITKKTSYDLSQDYLKLDHSEVYHKFSTYRYRTSWWSKLKSLQRFYFFLL